MEVYMKGKVDNQLGEVLIDTNVVAQYAGLAAFECFGLVGMAVVSMTDGLVKLLRRQGEFTKGVKVSLNENGSLVIDFHVIVAYGVSIVTVVENLQESVKYKVQEFTGIEVEKINVYVDDLRVID